MPPKRDLSHLEAFAYDVIGEPVPLTQAEKLAAAGGVEAGAEFIALARKIPHCSPPYRRQIFAYVERFIDFLKKYMPAELDHSAHPAHYPRLIGIFMWARVQWSKDNTQPGLNDEGVAEKRFMSKLTLHKHRALAQAAADALVYPATERDLWRVKKEIGQHVHGLINFLKLDREPVEKVLMGVDEIELLLDHLFNVEFVTASDVQMGCLLLTIMYTAARIGTLVSTPGYEDRFLQWNDLSFTASYNEANQCVGVAMTLKLRHWKGHQWGKKKLLVYDLKGIVESRNVGLDLPLLLFSHAWRTGVIEGSDGKTLAEAFAPEGATLFQIKEEWRSRPVFMRHKVGNRSELDPTGPLRSGTVFGRFRSLLIQTGLIGPDGRVPTLYALRRGTLNRWYFDPLVGPELARLLAGHEPDTQTLEEYYIVDQVDGRSVTLLDHLREIANKRVLTVTDMGMQQAFTRKSTSDLKEQDELYSTYCKAVTSLAMSVTLGNDAWKTCSPFSARPEKFAECTAEDALDHLTAFKLLADRRLAYLRSQEKQPASSDEPNSKANVEDRAIESEAMDSLEQLQTQLDSGTSAPQADVEDEIRIRPNESALGSPAADEEIDDDPGLLTAAELLSIKIEYAMDKTPSGDGTKLCGKCLCDPTSREDYRTVQWHPYRLHDHIRKYHSVEQTLKRKLIARGMDYKKPGKVTCTFPPLDGRLGRQVCGEQWSDTGFWQHLALHGVHMPEKELDWIIDHVNFKIDTRRDNRDKIVERPWQKNVVTPALPLYRYSYDIPKKVDSSRLPEVPHALQKLMDPAYEMPYLAADGKLRLPTVKTASDETMRELAEKLAEVYPRVPGALYKPDGITLDIDYTKAEQYFEAARGHLTEYEDATKALLAQATTGGTDVL